jgi:hypothetical protein
MCSLVMCSVVLPTCAARSLLSHSRPSDRPTKSFVYAHVVVASIAITPAAAAARAHTAEAAATRRRGGGVGEPITALI